MLDEIIALFHQPLIGAFVANAHLPVSWQVSPLRTYQQSIAVLITAEEKIYVAQVDALDTIPIDLTFTQMERSQFGREFSLLPDKRYFSIRTGKAKKDYRFSPELCKTARFPSAADYWDYLVQ